MRTLLLLLAFFLLNINYANASDFVPNEFEFTVELNIIPTQLNADIPNTSPSADVDDAAYMFGATVQWPDSTNSYSGLVKSVENYYQLFFAKSVVNIEDDYVESVTETAIIYGSKYYLQSAERKGFAVGWYAGVSLWDSEGYDYYGSTRYAPYSESGVSALVAGEVRYDYRLRIGEQQDLLIYPSIGFAFDKDFEELKIIPRIMVGLIF